MKEKGFTLIELLAVIVILAIIALIAVPIILNIIEDARNESNERSVELYASAIKNGIATHQLTGSEVPAGSYTSTEDKTSLTNGNGVTFKVEYEGNVECTKTEIYADGNIYLEGCTVNGTLVDYPYGEKEESEPTTPQVTRYYWNTLYGSGNISNGLPEGTTLNASDLESTYYLTFDVEQDEENNQKVIASYACFIRNGTEYCLKGNDTSEGVYATNQDILRDAYSDVVDTACSFDGGCSYCSADGLYVHAGSIGIVYAIDVNAICVVDGDGDFGCIDEL